jgi:hypothetical protein
MRVSRVESGPLLPVSSCSLLVTVCPDRGNPTKSPRLLLQYVSTARLSEDLNVIPAVDLFGATMRYGMTMTFSDRRLFIAR